MSPIRRLVAGAMVSGALGLAGLGLSGGPAAADPTGSAVGYNWCPGQALPFDNIRWDTNVCHTYYVVPMGTGNVRMVDLQGNPLSSFISADIPAPVFTAPPPPPPSGPRPFCSPRGSLIIIPPICDEIGY